MGLHGIAGQQAELDEIVGIEFRRSRVHAMESDEESHGKRFGHIGF